MWFLLRCAGVLVLVGGAYAWHRWSKQAADRAWAGDLVARVRKQEADAAEVAMLESWYEAESAEGWPT